MLTHDAVAASADATNARLGVGPDDHWLACLPLAHVGGLSVVTRALDAGTPLTVHAGFDAAAVGGQRGDARVARRDRARPHRPARFRTIVLGGAAPAGRLAAERRHARTG